MAAAAARRWDDAAAAAESWAEAAAAAAAAAAMAAAAESALARFDSPSWRADAWQRPPTLDSRDLLDSGGDASDAAAAALWAARALSAIRIASDEMQQPRRRQYDGQ